MSSIMQILRRIGGVKTPPTSGSAGQLALWKAGTAATDATSLYAHDGTQWTEVINTSAQWTANGADVYRAAGRVGIGVSNPQEKLHINGGGVIAQGATVATFLSPVDASNTALVGTTTNSDFVVYANNKEVARFAANGNIGVGLATAPDSDIHVSKLGRAEVKLHDSTAAHQILQLGTSQARGGHFVIGVDVYPLIIGTTDVERLRMDGTTGALTSPPTYNTPGTGSPVHVSSGGAIVRSSSSLKYKKDVEPLDPAIVDNAVKNLRPVWYRVKKAVGDVLPGWSHFGLIAEEVDKVEKRLVNYRTVEVSHDENGLAVETPLSNPVPEDVDYARLSVILLDYVQRLEKRVAALEARP